MRHLTGDGQPDGQPGDGGLAQFGEGVVGARGHARDRRVPAVGDDHPVGAVPAQNDDCADTCLVHFAGGQGAVIRGASHGHVQIVDLGEAQTAHIGLAFYRAHQLGADAAVFRHDQHLVDASRGKARQHPQHNICAVIDRQVPRMRHNAANVPG